MDEQTAGFNRVVEEALAAAPAIHTLEPAEIRAARERGEGIWPALETVPEAEVRTLPGPGDGVPVRVIAPPGTPRGVYLHLHGGGWTLGAAHHMDVANRALAQACGAVVVSVDYRLAPEHPYPAGPDDCEAAASWLAEKARAEFGTEVLLIGGESAGAHLAAVTLLRLRDRHGFTGFRAANLVYGCYDLELTPSVRRWGERNLILSTPIIEWFADHFVPDVAQRGEPDVSPLQADLRDLPPALCSVGTLDPLIDDTLFMHARWGAAGNRAELAVYPGGIHGFNAFPIALAERANARMLEFLRAALPAEA